MRFILDWHQKHELTEGETPRVFVSLINRELGGMAKYQIRMERHGDPDKEGGLE